MRLARLGLKDFRNYADLALIPQAGLNVLVGENAQGKSNVLEAIYMLATTKSLRAGRDAEVIRHGTRQAAISADLDNRSGELSLDLEMVSGERKVSRVNGARSVRFYDIVGHLNAVFFGALDLAIVTGDPSARRRFMNLDIAQMSPRYCVDLSNYKQVLDQRNKLLKELRERPGQESGIEAWTDQLVAHGVRLLAARRQFVEAISPSAAAIHAELTDGREELAVRYEPGVLLRDARDEEGISRAFHEKLARVAADEIRRGTTLAGPQRDDVALMVNGTEARAFGSQGQQRTVVLSLKLAEFDLIERSTGEAPIMLLDDVMSDLDDDRRRNLLSRLSDTRQSFITCTSLRSFPHELLMKSGVFHVRAGSIQATRMEEDRSPS